jgi:deazaflavin-dependent oxidoreductase (nitroreductase family)
MTEPEDWNAKVIAEFRANGGKVGGNFQGAPLLLLHTTGAKTGAERVHPMMYLPVGNELAVFASKAGAPSNPAWFTNLVADPDVTVEVGSETYAATARVTTGEERDRLYAQQASLYPGFAEYQEKTDRIIPVVVLHKAVVTAN